MCVLDDGLWDPNANTNSDSNGNMVDIGRAARHFGKHHLWKNSVYESINKTQRTRVYAGDFAISALVNSNLVMSFLSQLGAETLPSSIFLRASVFPLPASQSSV